MRQKRTGRWKIIAGMIAIPKPGAVAGATRRSQTILKAMENALAEGKEG